MHFRVLGTPYFTKAVKNVKVLDCIMKAHTPKLTFIHTDVKF